MAKVMSLQHALKFFLTLIVSIVLLVLGGVLSDRLTASPSSGMRWLGVVAAVVSLLPWLFVVAWSLANTDEYYRRVALVGTAAAFVVDLLVHTAFVVMVDAHLVSSTAYLPTLPVAMGVWMLSVALTALYYHVST